MPKSYKIPTEEELAGVTRAKQICEAGIRYINEQKQTVNLIFRMEVL